MLYGFGIDFEGAFRFFFGLVNSGISSAIDAVICILQGVLQGLFIGEIEGFAFGKNEAVVSGGSGAYLPKG